MKRLLLLWVMSLVIVSMATYAIAQTPRLGPTVSGNDIGFRVDGTDAKGQPFGTLLVRYKGEWVEAGSTMKVRKLQ